jgi:hypothetical protein
MAATSDAKEAMITMLTMFSIAGQILELPLEKLQKVVDTNFPMPGSEGLDHNGEQTMEEGRRIAIELVDFFKRSKVELKTLEKDLASWTPPMAVLERYMKKGPPKL